MHRRVPRAMRTPIVDPPPLPLTPLLRRTSVLCSESLLPVFRERQRWREGERRLNLAPRGSFQHLALTNNIATQNMQARSHYTHTTHTHTHIPALRRHIHTKARAHARTNAPHERLPRLAGCALSPSFPLSPCAFSTSLCLSLSISHCFSFAR